MKFERRSSLKLHERVEVLYEDIDCILIEKGAGVITYPVPNHTEISAIQLIRRYWKHNNMRDSHVYLLHRLDKDTSGLMIFAKTSLARKALLAQFENHSVLRRYFAVVQGIPEKPEGTLKTFLGRNKSGIRTVKSYGKEAITDYRVLRTNRQKQRSLVLCRLHTGRTHQIRIHMKHLHTPVVGDPVYGNDRKNQLALFACSLGFIHPRSGQPLLFHASLPASLKTLMD
jgi:23S rRNA pseudouridine1911/1915/1917 synthase